MALIKCSECGKEVSDKAAQCPNCGAPVTDADIAKGKKKKTSLRFYRNIFFLFLVLLIAISLLGKNNDEPAEDVASETERADQKKDPCANIKTIDDWSNASELWRMANKQCNPANKKQGDVIDVVPAAALWKEFNDNEVAANKKYQGKTVAVEGRIHSIESSLMGYPEIVFNVAHGIQTVRCQFSKKSSDAIAEMKKGQRVIVIGKVETFVLGSMLSLGDCYFGERIQ